MDPVSEDKENCSPSPVKSSAVSEDKENNRSRSPVKSKGLDQIFLRSNKRQAGWLCDDNSQLPKVSKPNHEGGSFKSQPPKLLVSLPISLFKDISVGRPETSSCLSQDSSSSTPFSLCSPGNNTTPHYPLGDLEKFSLDDTPFSEQRLSRSGSSASSTSITSRQRSHRSHRSAARSRFLSSDSDSSGSTLHSNSLETVPPNDSALEQASNQTAGVSRLNSSSDSDSGSEEEVFSNGSTPHGGSNNLETSLGNISASDEASPQLGSALPSDLSLSRQSLRMSGSHSEPDSASLEPIPGTVSPATPPTPSLRVRPERNILSDSVSDTSRKKVRVRQGTSKSRLERKIARNRGAEYTTSSGKLISKIKAKPLTICRKKCMEKISHEVATEVCDSVWQELGDADARRAYISGQINSVEKKSERLNKTSSRNRAYSYTYHVCVKGSNIEVCKGCFMKVYQVKTKFIELAVANKLSNPAGAQRKDQRGLASKSAADDKINELKDHINSFPRYKSHYGRSQNENEFLPSTLSLKIMFDEYCNKVEAPLSRWVYEREFHKLGLKIKPLKIDTCHTCDTLEMAVKYSEPSEKDEKLLEQEKHHRAAETAIEKKREDKKKAQTEESVETVAFDLQQCLPTPNLASSIIFYLRQLWVYNLTIHLMSNGKSVHNMWHEAEGGRGANQVGSALYSFIMNLPDSTEHLILWSDTCGGQNKNSIINSALITALSCKKTLKIIDQKFLISGHTHLECDSDHATIEAKKKTAPEIHVPRDWYNLVRGASKKFEVKHLSQNLQYDFKLLTKGKASPLVKRKKTVSKEKFAWKNIVWVQHRRDLPKGVIAFKKSFDDDDEFSLLDMRRKPKKEAILTLENAYDGPICISPKKKTDLLSMLHLIDPDCHFFYHALATDVSIPDNIDLDLRPNSDIEDSEEE
ncbi:hypothetical protein FOCC_FOCC015421 [Frankliniella occidentalis]|nr:hypothetical protein FOCC_FOCC015421 [Frankliniella occidentalis]